VLSGNGRAPSSDNAGIADTEHGPRGGAARQDWHRFEAPTPSGGEPLLNGVTERVQ